MTEEIMLNMFGLSILEALLLVGGLVLVGFILGVIEKRTNQYCQMSWGRKGVMATAWLGTPIHEIGHAIMCILFLHRITDLRLLITDSTDGTLGYVSHEYDSKSLYQSIGNFFIGIAPILSGIGAIFVSMYFLLPNSFRAFELYFKSDMKAQMIDANLIKQLFESSVILMQNIFSPGNLLTVHFWIFILITVCVSSHIALSRQDMKGATSGLVTLLFFLYFVNVIAQVVHFTTYKVVVDLTKYNAYILAFSMVAILFSILVLGVNYGIYLVKRNRIFAI